MGSIAAASPFKLMLPLSLAARFGSCQLNISIGGASGAAIVDFVISQVLVSVATDSLHSPPVSSLSLSP